MIYVLCYPRLQEANAEAIEAFRRRHEPQRAELVRAHVTLVFGTRSVSTDALIEQTRAAAAAMAPFEISLEQTEIFDDRARGEHKLFLLVQRGKAQFDTLYRRLHSGALAAETEQNIAFQPHITIATACSLDELQAAKAESAALDLPFEGHIDRLSVERLEGNELTPLAEVKL